VYILEANHGNFITIIYVATSYVALYINAWYVLFGQHDVNSDRKTKSNDNITQISFSSLHYSIPHIVVVVNQVFVIRVKLITYILATQVLHVQQLDPFPVQYRNQITNVINQALCEYCTVYTSKQ